MRPSDAAIGKDGDVTIVVPQASVDRLRGSRLEFANEGGGGLVLVNPNSPTPEEINPGLPADILALGVDGPLGSVAVTVLEDQVNPAIAQHGGRADLMAMDEESQVRLHHALGRLPRLLDESMTLSQGIETMLREAIPELEQVLDVTDHASGDNPFYTN